MSCHHPAANKGGLDLEKLTIDEDEKELGEFLLALSIRLFAFAIETRTMIPFSLLRCAIHHFATVDEAVESDEESAAP